MLSKTNIRQLLACAASAFMITGVTIEHAAAQPEGGELLRELERDDRRDLPTSPPAKATPQPPPESSGPRVPIQRFVFEGNTLLSEAELQPVVAPWLNKALSLEELKFIADAVAVRYREAGYLVRSYLPQQDVENGTIRIVIVEARLGEIRVDDGGEEQLRASRTFARKTVEARQRPGKVLALDSLERSAQLLNDTPGMRAQTVLAAGEEAGMTDVVINLADGPLLTGFVSADNFGSRSTGAERVSTGLSLDNPSGFGDQVQLYGQVSDGSLYARLRYAAPVGHDGIRAGISTSHYQYELGKEFKALEAEGDANTVAADIRYPVIRQRLRNLHLVGRIEQRNYENQQLGQTTSDKKVSSITFGFFGDIVDDVGGGGFNVYNVSLIGGHLDLSGNAEDRANDANSAQRHGSFQKLAWSLGRLQRLTGDTTLWASARGQFAGDNLDSSEGFSLGGPTAVRAYPVLEGSGDEGWVATLELRHQLTTPLTAIAFYDHGRIRQHKEPWVGWNAADPNQLLSHELSGAGIGLTWNSAGGFNLSLIAARRFGSNPMARPDNGYDSDGTLEKNRLWLSTNYYF